MKLRPARSTLCLGQMRELLPLFSPEKKMILYGCSECTFLCDYQTFSRSQGRFPRRSSRIQRCEICFCYIPSFPPLQEKQNSSPWYCAVQTSTSLKELIVRVYVCHQVDCICNESRGCVHFVEGRPVSMETQRNLHMLVSISSRR